MYVHQICVKCLEKRLRKGNVMPSGVITIILQPSCPTVKTTQKYFVHPAFEIYRITGMSDNWDVSEDREAMGRNTWSVYVHLC